MKKQNNLFKLKERYKMIKNPLKDIGSKYEPTDADNKNISDTQSNVNKIYDLTGKKKSIIGAAKDNIFEFPVFIASSVSLEYATATNSLLEQLYASYLQMAISIDPIINSKDLAAGKQFAKFKTNTNRYLEYTDMTYAHDACHNVCECDGIVTEFDMITCDDKTAKIINEYCDYVPLSEFSHFFQEADNDDAEKARLEEINRMVAKMVADEHLKNAKEKHEMEKEKHAINKDKDSREELLDAQKYDDNKRKARDYTDDRQMLKDKHGWDKDKRDNDIGKNERDKEKHGWDKEDRESNKSKLDKENKLKDAQLDDYGRKAKDHDEDRQMARERHGVDMKVKAPQFIDETKIQKLNTMKPLLMTVNLRIENDKSGLSERPMEYIIGVKTFSRLIDADILPEVVEYPLKEMDKIARKAKWRAGELKFFKDILFKIKQKKQTAYDSRDSKRKWYRRLYDLAHKQNYTKGRDMMNNGFEHGIPNATMIISQSDVVNIKAQTGIDMLNGSKATKFCRELFLMAFIVIDTDAESIKILIPDMHNDYEIHSLASVNKQLAALSTAGTKTNDLLKLLG